MYWTNSLFFPIHKLMQQSFESFRPPPPLLWEWPGHSLFMQVKASEFSTSLGHEWWTPPPLYDTHVYIVHSTPF